MCFNETWLDDSISDSLLTNNECYSIVRHDRLGKKGGGVLALVKEVITLSVIELCQLSMSELIAFDILYSNTYVGLFVPIDPLPMTTMIYMNY